VHGHFYKQLHAAIVDGRLQAGERHFFFLSSLEWLNQFLLGPEDEARARCNDDQSSKTLS